MNEENRFWLDALLVDHQRRVAKVQEPMYGLIEAAKIVETTVLVVNELLCLPERVRVDAWYDEFKKRNCPLAHPSTYLPLMVIGPSRNLPAHPNIEGYAVTHDRVARALRDIRELLPRLADDLARMGCDFVGKLQERQQVSLGLYLAKQLESAIKRVGLTPEVAERVTRAAFRHLKPGQRTEFAKAPPMPRLGRELTALGLDASGGTRCALREVASALVDLPGFKEEINSWLSDAAHLSLVASPPPERIKTIRIKVEPDGTGWRIAAVDLIWPANWACGARLPVGPILAPGPGELRRELTRLVERVAAINREDGIPGEARDYVLRLAVPPELATYEWELLRATEHHPPLWNAVAAVTVEPIDYDRDVTAALAEPVQPEEHVALLWGISEPDELNASAGGRPMMIVGPQGWDRMLGGRAPVLYAMENAAAVLLSNHETPDEARAEFVPEPLSFADILKRVRNAWIAKRRVKVLWTDRAYTIPEAIAG